MQLYIDSDAAYLVLLTLCKRLRNVVSSTAEAETGSSFINTQHGIPIIQILEALGHKQHHPSFKYWKP